MAKLSKSLQEYEQNGGWSSSLFFNRFMILCKELKASGHVIDVGRSVVHIDDKLKCYVHHNGRSKEYATITDMNGVELITRHYTQIDELEKYIKESLNM